MMAEPACRHPHQGWLRQWTDEDRRLVDEAIATLQLQPLRRRSVDDLSGGQVQRVWLAMIMAQNTEMVLLDEPTGNLDQQTAESIQQLMLELSQTLQTAFLVVTHDLALAARMDRTFTLKQGQLREQV